MVPSSSVLDSLESTELSPEEVHRLEVLSEALAKQQHTTRAKLDELQQLQDKLKQMDLLISEKDHHLKTTLKA